MAGKQKGLRRVKRFAPGVALAGVVALGGAGCGSSNEPSTVASTAPTQCGKDDTPTHDSRTERIWDSRYTCPTKSGSQIYEQPSDTSKVTATLVTDPSWVMCRTPGDATWYYTQGDIHPDSTGWGFLPGADVRVDKPKSVPECPRSLMKALRR